MTTREFIRSRDGITLSTDPGRMPKDNNAGLNQIAVAIVGHNESSPEYVRIENNQPYVEVRIVPEGDEVIARLALGAAGEDAGAYMSITYGCRVLLAMPDGDPNNSIIIGRLHDDVCPMPDNVAGVSTGVVDGKGPAPAWQFIKTPDGQLLAIETGEGADIIIHTDSSFLAKSSNGFHFEGPCYLGYGPSSPPVGGTVGEDGDDTPSTPAIPHIPTPYTQNPPPSPGHVPYAGNAEGIIRAKDLFQFSEVSDPIGYAQFIAPYIHPIINVPPPVSMVSSARNSPTGTGSKHTASD